LAITLVRFGAHVQADGVVLQWETGAEFATLGFRLWRSTDGQRPSAVPIGDLIMHKGGTSGGATYTYIDTAIVRGATYTYWLQEVRGDQTTEDLASLMLTVAEPVYLPFIARP
jgi:hypothetical protein